MNTGERLLTVFVLGTSLAAQALADSEDRRDRKRERGHQVVTIDHFVPHISTVPANQGELVHLFVRERTTGAALCACSSDADDRGPGEDYGHKRPGRKAVLMIHGRSAPVLPGMDLGSDDYNWALSLARAGIDVFMLDFQGSGRSPRPKMDDPCNVPIAQQKVLLIPNPLKAFCQPSYPFVLNTSGIRIDDLNSDQASGSDEEELDRVVDYIRDLRGVDKVHLISWSQGSFRIGPYAVKHPEKVASLFFLAPIFNNTNTALPTTVPRSSLPRTGTPMALTKRGDFFASWNAEQQCEGEREPGIQDIVWAAIMDNDRLGRTWGPPPEGAPAGSAPEGVMRVRQVTLWGWTSDVAVKLTVPTLIIRGEFDSGLGARQDVSDVIDVNGLRLGLYSLVQNSNKLRFHVLCAGHFMPWEKQRTVLHDISQQWIKHGRVAGHEQGEFVVDAEGNVSPLPPLAN